MTMLITNDALTESRRYVLSIPPHIIHIQNPIGDRGLELTFRPFPGHVRIFRLKLSFSDMLQKYCAFIFIVFVI